MIRFTLFGTPRTKKNSQRIVRAGRYSKILPSAAYAEYAIMRRQSILTQGVAHLTIQRPVNVKAVYYMPTHRRVDLVNLLEATDDILVDTGVIADDNSQIVAGHDWSRVRYDKDNPRVEIEITEME